MNILAFETSCEHASVALLTGEQVIQTSFAAAAEASANALPAAHALLAQAALRLTDIECVAYGAGPGAFTGIRLACSLAQGLALALDLPVFGLSSLELLVLGYLERHPASVPTQQFLCAIDARMGELYVGRFQHQAGRDLGLLTPACCLGPEQLIEEEVARRTASANEVHELIGLGSGFLRYPRLKQAFPTCDPHCHPDAAVLARYACARPASWQDAATASPLYVRDKVALTVAERAAVGGRP